jgi:hypothetical protein
MNIASVVDADAMPVKKKMIPIAAKLAMAPTKPANAIKRQLRCVAKLPDPRNMTCADLVDAMTQSCRYFAIVDDQLSRPVKFRDT